jgi:hypothetical protein
MIVAGDLTQCTASPNFNMLSAYASCSLDVPFTLPWPRAPRLTAPVSDHDFRRSARLYSDGINELRRQLDDLKNTMPPAGTSRAEHLSNMLTAIVRSSLAKITLVAAPGDQPPDPPYDPQREFYWISNWFASTLSQMLAAEIETPGRIPDIVFGHLILTFWLYVDAEKKRLDEEGYYLAHPRRPA